MPDMVPVASSNVAAIGYDGETRDLYVEFNNGTTYVYGGVDRLRYEDMLSNPSPGGYLNRWIKPNHSAKRA